MIADETIDRVRREAKVVAIVGERVKLTQRGRSHIGLCPFHKEKTPSFNVNAERGFYHCFGCGASGDAIKFVRELDGLSFVDAVRHIAERQGIEVVETGSEAERREQSEARRRRDELFAAGEAAAVFFEKMLQTHPLAHLAHAELARRGLSEGEQAAVALKAFRVGYAPYAWDGFARTLRTGAGSLRAAEAVGLVVPRKSGPGHYDRFRHRLMFAIVDLDGRIVGWSGRALAEPSEEALRSAGVEALGSSGEPPAKYLNSPESSIYKKREVTFGLFQARQAIRQEDRAILVEGNFDVVSLHARGVANAIAPLGTAFTEEQASQIRRYSQNVTLLFDGDGAGRRAVRAARDPARAAGLVVAVGKLPDGKDPDEVARAGGSEAVLRYVKSARSLLEYLIDSELDGFGANDAVASAAKLKAVAELIRGEDDPAVRAFAERHADAIAERLGIADARTFRALGLAMQRAVSGHGTAGPEKVAPAAPDRARSRGRSRDIALEVMGAFFDFPSLFEEPETAEAVNLLEGDVAVAIAALRQDPALVSAPEHLLAKLPASIHPFAAARLAAPRHQSASDAKAELLGNVEKLKRSELTRHKSETIEELSRMQSSGDFDREIALLGAQARRVRERHGL